MQFESWAPVLYLMSRGQ